MRTRVLVVVMLWCLISATATAGELTKAEIAIDKVLSSFHQAASEANGDFYFSLFTDDAVFMGTDATERWSVDEFKAFAEPYFSEGKGWKYTKTERHIYVSLNGKTAWFDEMLWNDSYGTCRGTGVLLLVEGDWRIAQYSLSIPIPNDLAGKFTTRIKGQLAAIDE